MTSVELQVAGEPYVLYRCGDCNSSYWMRDGVQVAGDEVTAALREQTAATAAARADRAAARAARARR